MITPKQLKNHEFQSVGRNAYKSTDVDEYMNEVYQSYEQMFRENAELVKKLGMLADKISEYKKDEDNIRNALLMAERMKDSILSEANEKAKEALSIAEEKVREAKVAVDKKTEEILSEAQRNADKIIRESNEHAEETLKAAQSNATKLLARAQEIYDDQVNVVKEEAEKEREYLNKVKEESAKIRTSLMDTYKMQIELLEFTPDFSEEIAKIHAEKKKSIDTIDEEETENDDSNSSDDYDEEPEDEAFEDEVTEDEDFEDEETENENPEEEDEDVSEKVDEYINDDSSEEFFELKIDESASDITIMAEDDEGDVAVVIDEGSPIDKYINSNQTDFEDVDTGRSNYDEDQDYNDEEDYEKSVYTPDDEITFFNRNED